ncbi:TetR/AcrR family transcriptional regulator [Pseudidiomarina sediminum]|uniref:TetR/AcrR family transcriptional regulator n=1 Tax=Pseudidiomarina sediminum TaxID=431675 RepID=A0A432ZAI9_9GAMM|nr:TetR/AcrR family transcriptional regulator [Pseudidiomarina sediminum]RUO74948.1 TetR/AcrR family transcriptional regulator [Pseudidiomarina sediminum]
MTETAYPLTELDYPAILLHEKTHSPAKRKGERTKQSLVWACAKLLNQIGYQELRVSDICDEAQVSSAAFYLYFDNKSEITQHTLEHFCTAIFNALLLGQPHETDHRQALYQRNLAWLRISRLNAGLMRCVLQVTFVIPEFATFYDTLNADYISTVAKNIAKRSQRPESETQILVFALSSMTDEFTRRLLSDTPSPLDAMIKQECKSETELATFLSDLWFNAIYIQS